MRSALLFFLLITFTFCQAEQNKRFYTNHWLMPKDSSAAPTKKHSPKKASIYSALLPGLGQACNEKYWKIPIVFAAIGISAYFIKDNRYEMLKRQNALIAILDGDSSTVADAEFINIPVSILKAQRNTFRTNRDYSIIALAGFYLLNIVDAAVDAHFYKFNIDKPLAEQRHKRWHLYAGSQGNRQNIGLSWTF